MGAIADYYLRTNGHLIHHRHNNNNNNIIIATTRDQEDRAIYVCTCCLVWIYSCICLTFDISTISRCGCCFVWQRTFLLTDLRKSTKHVDCCSFTK